MSDEATSIQGDMNGWMNLNDPLDDTLTFNQTGLVCSTSPYSFVFKAKLTGYIGRDDAFEGWQHLGRVSSTLRQVRFRSQRWPKVFDGEHHSWYPGFDSVRRYED